MRKIIIFLFILFFSSSAFADFQVATGQITSPTSTGNQSITGLAFQPKVIIFYSSIVSALTGGYNYGFGVGTSSSARWTVGFNAQETTNFSTSYISRNLKSNKIISIPYTTAAPANAIYLEADLISLDSGGATINWTTVQASGFPINYIALGGTSLSVNVGTFDSGSGTGNKSVTGIGFAPTSVFIANGIGGTTEGVANTVRGSMGVASSPSAAEALAFQHAQTGVTPLWDATAGQVASQIIERPNNTATFQATWDFVSNDVDGFTIHASVNAAAIRYGYIAIGGVNSVVGVFNQPGSTGNQTVSGLSFTPSLEIFMGIGHTTTSSAFQDYDLSMGVAISSSSRNVSNFSGTHSDGGSRVIAGSDGSTAKIIQFITPNTGGGTPTLNSEADFVSQDSTGFTINWSTADATAREVVYWALGLAGGPSTHYDIIQGGSIIRGASIIN